MSLEIDGYQQWMLMLKAILCGGCLGIFYDFFRFLRVMKKFGKYSVAVQDIIFWCVCAVAVFTFMMIYSCGVVRIDLVIGFAIGGIMYYFSFGRITFALFMLLKKIILSVEKFVVKYLLRPIFKFLNKHIFSHVKKLMMRSFGTLKFFFKKFFDKNRKVLAKSPDFVV